MTFNEVHRVIKIGDLVSLRVELDAGLNPSLSNQFSWPLLMLAAMEGNTAIGELLVSSGAELDTINDFGETALSLAAHGEHNQRSSRVGILGRHGRRCTVGDGADTICPLGQPNKAVGVEFPIEPCLAFCHRAA